MNSLKLKHRRIDQGEAQRAKSSICNLAIDANDHMVLGDLVCLQLARLVEGVRRGILGALVHDD